MIKVGFTVVAAALAFNAHAWDAGKGAEKAKQVCAACHGEKGTEAKVPGAAILAGQHRDYLYHSLRDYKTGKRKNAIMNGQAQALTDEEMRNLAAFYASQDGPLKVVR